MELEKIPQDACCIVFGSDGKISLACKMPSKDVLGKYPEPPAQHIAAVLAFLFLVEQEDEVIASMPATLNDLITRFQKAGLDQGHKSKLN